MKKTRKPSSAGAARMLGLDFSRARKKLLKRASLRQQLVSMGGSEVLNLIERLQFYRMRKSILADPVKELRERYANEALSLLNEDEKQNKPLRRKAAVRPGPPMSLNVRSRMRGGKR